MYEYPYQNLHTVDMPNEVWNPVPDFENYYMVSNMGRVKSLEREVPLNIKPSVYHILPERILYQKLQVNKNLNTLRVLFAVDNVHKEVMVRNLVYTVFVDDSVDLEKYDIINIDGIGENCRVGNLTKRLRRKQDRKAQERHEKRLKEGWSDDCIYQNLSLEDMKGEIWKPLVGYEEYYMISNLGRVKSLPRNTERIINGNLLKYEIKESIRKQVLDTRKKNARLSSSINIDKHRKEFQIPHAVYSTFVESFDIKEYKIVHLDGDTLNNRVENLKRVKRKQIAHKSI